MIIGVLIHKGSYLIFEPIKNIMSNKVWKLIHISCCIILICNQITLVSSVPASNNVNQERLIPFIGMILEYKLNVKTSFTSPSSEGWVVPLQVNWTIHYDQYNTSQPELFISYLLLEVNFLSVVTTRSENGSIIENITNRQVQHVDVEDTDILAALYDVYYSPNDPNYTPFYINTSNITIGSEQRIYNYTMQVISSERVAISLRNKDIGYRDVWNIQFQQNLTGIEHFISLLYDDITGILVGGRLFTQWKWGPDRYTSEASIIIARTNALTLKKLKVNTNYMIMLSISLVPLIAIVVRIVRIKEIEGGL